MAASTLIHQMRRERRLTQADLARRSGVPRTAINAYESGRRVPTATTLLRLAEACDVTIGFAPRREVDLEAQAQTLEQVLDLAELLPQNPKSELRFPPLPS